jgi:hypothetical protein
MYVTQDRVHLRDLVTMAMNIRVPYSTRNLLTSRATINFSRAHLHKASVRISSKTSLQANFKHSTAFWKTLYISPFLFKIPVRITLILVKYFPIVYSYTFEDKFLKTYSSTMCLILPSPQFIIYSLTIQHITWPKRYPSNPLWYCP